MYEPAKCPFCGERLCIVKAVITNAINTNNEYSTTYAPEFSGKCHQCGKFTSVGVIPPKKSG